MRVFTATLKGHMVLTLSPCYVGIWTDGIWAFFTGLDQRIRCWQIDHFGKLTEHAHLIISVPEPETMDAMVCDR